MGQFAMVAPALLGLWREGSRGDAAIVCYGTGAAVQAKALAHSGVIAERGAGRRDRSGSNIAGGLAGAAPANRHPASQSFGVGVCRNRISAYNPEMKRKRR